MRFVTLGPSGNNHEMVTRKYIKLRGLDAEVILIDDFFEGLEMLRSDAADFLLQVAVHPDCASVVARGHFEFGVHVVDTFISPSKDLAVITRKDVERPTALALQPATEAYADLSAWPEKIAVSSIMRIAEGLLSGKYESGLTTLEFAQKHPDKLRVDITVKSLDDPWIVFGKKRVANGEPVIWPDSPVLDQF
ncbi:hypothetical protein E1162_06935 [Rhodobacteraceae bacterium RKSG542]|uniref:hypothetical protein n=1 Tax=Pseudovibrio flavus TaxID=2529854 RepID=UPI0012BB8521|nr:hypothetical protein [Pseudovibrio flavus]MTI16971.1 hypothetical protein [Pseudovibrio flavus]